MSASPPPEPAAPGVPPDEVFELAEGGWVEIWNALMPGPTWLERLLAELPLAVEHYRMFGRNVASPREVVWIGDPGTGYRYTGIRHEPAPWTEALLEVKRSVQAACGLQFNSVLANHYRDGRDWMSWHSDNEPEIGPTVDDRWVASVSFGAPRRFSMRPCKRGFGPSLSRALGGGDLLVMRGTTQTYYQHSLARNKSVRPVGARLNLTFRYIANHAP